MLTSLHAINTIEFVLDVRRQTPVAAVPATRPADSRTAYSLNRVALGMQDGNAQLEPQNKTCSVYHWETN